MGGKRMAMRPRKMSLVHMIFSGGFFLGDYELEGGWTGMTVERVLMRDKVYSAQRVGRQSVTTG